MPLLKYYDTVTSQWVPILTGAKGDTGDTGPTGPQGPAGLGSVTVTQPITNSGTSTAAVLGISPDAIVQIKSSVYTGSEITNSTTTYVDTGLTGTITPKFSNSTILIMIYQSLLKNTSSGSNSANIRLLRSSTVVKTLTSIFLSGTATEFQAPVSFTHLDNPATTSAITYKTQFANNITSPVIVTNRGHQPTMLLIEIKQ
jgi:hypothetical protein